MLEMDAYLYHKPKYKDGVNVTDSELRPPLRLFPNNSSKLDLLRAQARKEA